ncbi:serine hydroxymethyltransferase-domain-containing protein [Pyronema domesticum]|uniref:Serine hydroxymethyltransferase n=1 Tax=Pyronema omphalodes (strain CBS 100304) TaxID=1076935 RepID=U4LPV4_PYROM|nr:serine hydroxymethyltransferase-domain-containing protein [Pyronema domesticum]CCX31350.1 Similar to Putative serine hydroxymethyltransferase, mitochondrial; acc. no. Q7S5N8 [Pyronema omphalodes CBS 100304]
MLARTTLRHRAAIKATQAKAFSTTVARTAGNLSAQQEKLLSDALPTADPEVSKILEAEKLRQKECINLIASENFASQSVMDALGSPMQNKYSEGYPGARYYGGNQHIDSVERLCRQRALEAFRLDSSKWGVNVQPLSGSPANLYVYGALLRPHERIMGLDLPHGGHLSHGYQTPTKKISKISEYFETLPYRLDPVTGLIDYDALEKMAEIYRPKIIVAGATAYSRFIDYERFRKICDKVGAYLMADIAHLSGMVAAGVIPGPFEHADIVTTTTHKSLRGPRGAMIFMRKGVRSVDSKGTEIQYQLEDPINASVFPGHQGGPHNHTITALAVALGQAKTAEFKAYQTSVLANARALSDRLQSKDYNIVSGGTDNHLVLVDLKNKGIDGARVERVLEIANIVTNKNTVPGDKSALKPGGLRLGSPAMTTRGLEEEDFRKVGDFLDRGVEITRMITSKNPEVKKVKDFLGHLAAGERYPEIEELRKEVAEWTGAFPLPWKN